MKFKDLRAKLNEDKALRNEVIPAPMLVLRRKGIRIFPDGKHVALYTNDKYNLVFTIPYGGSATAGELEPSPVVTGQPSNG
jgi:hypothetical protein